MAVPCDQTLDFYFKRGETRRVEYELTGRRECWTEERRRVQAERMRAGYRKPREEKDNAAENG